jgi:chitinase
MTRKWVPLAAAGAAVATALAVGLISLAGGASAATNLLANPGFDSDLSGWSCSSIDQRVTSPTHTGAGALAGTPAGQDFAQCSQAVSVQPSSAYTLSAWVQGSYTFLGDTGTGATDTSTWTAGSSSWTQLSTSFSTGASTHSVTVWIHGWYGTGTFDADDLVLSGPGGGGGGPTTPPPTTSSPSPTPTPTSSPPPSGGPLPKHVLTGYWQNFNNGAKVLRLRDVPSQYNLIAVAFADTDPARPGGVTFNVDSGLSSALGGYTNADLANDVTTLHGQGRRVILSVGGQNGTVSVGDATSATNFANSVFAAMQQFHFDGVDIDLENGINPSAMASALQQLSGKAGSGLIITLAPQTIDMQSTGNGYFQLALNIKSILTIVNMQYYNSGTMLGCDGNVYAQATENFLTALACIQLQGGLRPDQVGLGLPASPSAAGGGFVNPSVVNAALDCLARGTNCGSFKPPTTWPSIRGAMTWSVNWDGSNGNNFANTVGPHLGTLP